MKKTLSILLALLMALSAFPLAGLSAFAEDAQPQELPIEIRTVADLYAVRNNLSGNYILMNDIDLTEATAQGGDYDNNGRGWAPIGENKDLAFSGTFDGSGYSIIGMRIKDCNTEYGGLFGYVTGAIKNLTLENVSISTSKGSCGAICGYLGENAWVLSCKVSGDISNNGTQVGGVVGRSESGSITECVNSANVSGDIGGQYDYGIGGIVGYSKGAVITECINTGNIRNNYGYGSVHYAGGICGKGEYNNIVSNCINTGLVSASYSNSVHLGAIIGESYSATVEKNYYLTGSASSGYNVKDTATTCVALSAAQMLLESSFGYLDFENTWFIDPGLGVTHPQLRNNPEILADEISVAQPAAKLTYTHHEPIDTAGMTINVRKGETVYEKSVTPNMITGYDEASIGPQTLTVNYLGRTATYNIFVLELPVDEIALNYEEFNVDIGNTVQLAPTFVPENATDTTATFVSSKPEIATVDENGLVTGVDRGDAVITAMAASGAETFCTVHVQKPATALRFAKNSLVLNAGETGEFGVILTPEDATDIVTWSSANENIATVDENGVVTGVEYGKTTVTGTTTRGLIYGGTVSVKTHAFGEYEFNNDATCTEDGTMTAHCLYCDAVDTVIDEGTALGHNYLDVRSNPTCTEDGYTSHFCTRCGVSFTDGHTDATGHRYINKASDDYLASPATCTAAAVYYKSCYSCGAPSEETFSYGSPLRHKYTARVVSADCENDGYTEYTCSKCGDSYIGNNVPATGHRFSDEWTVDKAATCTAAGEKSRHCEICGERIEITGIPATGHAYGEWTKLDDDTHRRVCANDPAHVETAAHAWDKGVVIEEATCEGEGLRAYTCTVCGGTKTEPIASLGHNYSASWTIDRAASCTVAGEKSLHCTRCDARTRITAIPATGHSYGAWTNLNATYHQRVCANDSAHVEKKAHTWNSGKITKAATRTATGVKTYTCTVCKATRTETIPILPGLNLTVPTGSKVGDVIKVSASLGGATGFKSGTFALTWDPAVLQYVSQASDIPGAMVEGGKIAASEATVSVILSNPYAQSVLSLATFSFKVLKYSASTALTLGVMDGDIDGVAEPAKKTVKVQAGQPPLTKIAVAAANAVSGVKLTWKKDANATGYIVYRKTGSGSYVTLKKITSNATVSYVDTTASLGETYTYAVRSYNGTVKGAYTAKAITFQPKLTPTLANAAGGVTVKWTKVNGAAGYYVYRKTGSGSYAKIATIKSGATVSYADTAVKANNGTKYAYIVKAYKGSVVSAYAAKAIVRLTGVAISSATNSAAKTMTVKYAKNAKATGYQIQYATDSKFTSAKTVTVAGAANVSKAIAGLVKGNIYCVRVRAYITVSGVNYYSAWSSALYVTIAK